MCAELGRNTGGVVRRRRWGQTRTKKKKRTKKKGKAVGRMPQPCAGSLALIDSERRSAARAFWCAAVRGSRRMAGRRRPHSKHRVDPAPLLARNIATPPPPVQRGWGCVCGGSAGQRRPLLLPLFFPPPPPPRPRLCHWPALFFFLIVVRIPPFWRLLAQLRRRCARVGVTDPYAPPRSHRFVTVGRGSQGVARRRRGDDGSALRRRRSPVVAASRRGVASRTTRGRDPGSEVRPRSESDPRRCFRAAAPSPSPPPPGPPHLPHLLHFPAPLLPSTHLPPWPPSPLSQLFT